MLIHNIEPIFDKNSKILILGSFPSVKSREQEFFYGHPQNRFWKVISTITKEVLPQTIEDKKMLLLRNSIAVWDVIKLCDITGSSDSSITNVVPNDIYRILNSADIKRIYANGDKSYSLFKKYFKELDVIKLPSTSPANAQYSLERLIEEWKIILN
ncbi:MAG: DNA-deoxyinosine glycosylase [Clostridiales bacterium]|nr:DNA-deoxyinosine glycosylase [Clostridiales bacterium]